jgi:hypothetical protein
MLVSSVNIIGSDKVFIFGEKSFIYITKSKGPRSDLWGSYNEANITLTTSAINYIEFCNIKEDHKFRVYDNRLQRIIFKLGRDEETEGWRRLHNEELHNLYSLLYIIRIIQSRNMGSSCSTHGGNEKCVHYFN